MSAPMLLPLILLGGATIALAAASKKKYDAPPPGTVRTYTLDTTLPQTVRDQVLAALATEQDPTKLEAFASAIAPTFPLSAAALRQKASMLRAGTLPTNPVDLLTQVPDPPRTQVMQQLLMQNDPNALEAYAAQLQAQYPAAAAALRLKEAVLRGQAPEVAPPTPGNAAPVPPAISPSAPAIPSAPPIAPTPPPAAISIPALTIPLPTILPSVPTPQQDPPAAPAAPPAPIPSVVPPFISGLDANMPPEMQKAVMGALTTESDPAKLEGFASAIQAQYPIASGLLEGQGRSTEVNAARRRRRPCRLRWSCRHYLRSTLRSRRAVPTLFCRETFRSRSRRSSRATAIGGTSSSPPIPTRKRARTETSSPFFPERS